MQPIQNIMHCYDSTAAEYTGKFMNELDHKHLDKILLYAFADENKDKGKLIDLGCGPGQTTMLLKNYGVHDIIGMDLSAEMVAQANGLNPDIEFETGDMLQLKYTDESFGSAVAFYAIVHFDDAALSKAFTEIYRILKPGGQLLLSYHIGDGMVHYDNFLDKPVNIDFYMWQTDKVLAHAQNAGFTTVDVIERRPYADVEYPSTRAYLWLNK